MVHNYEICMFLLGEYSKGRGCIRKSIKEIYAEDIILLNLGIKRNSIVF